VERSGGSVQVVMAWRGVVAVCRWSWRREEWWQCAGGHGVERSGGSVQVVMA